jgi:hypothetical protein
MVSVRQGRTRLTLQHANLAASSDQGRQLRGACSVVADLLAYLNCGSGRSAGLVGPPTDPQLKRTGAGAQN